MIQILTSHRQGLWREKHSQAALSHIRDQDADPTKNRAIHRDDIQDYLLPEGELQQKIEP
jgi:hypothetical protein